MVRLAAIPRGRRLAQTAAIAAGTGCLSAWFGIAMAGTTGAVAAGPCTTATPPATTGIDLHVDTTGGCDQAGTLAYPISGTFAANVGSAGGTVTVPVILEGLSTQMDYWGSYAVSFVCTTGTSASPAYSYTVDETSTTYPDLPTTTGGLPRVTADALGDVVCSYTFTVQNAPGGHLNSAKVEMWLVSGSTELTHTATTSFDPPVLPVSTPTPTGGSTPTPTAASTPTPTAASTPTPTAASTPTPTAGSTPTPTPTAGSTPTPSPTAGALPISTPTPVPGGVEGITTTPAPQDPRGGGVLGTTGTIGVPNTGAAPSGGNPWLAVSGLVLLAAGGLLGRRPKQA